MLSLKYFESSLQGFCNQLNGYVLFSFIIALLARRFLKVLERPFMATMRAQGKYSPQSLTLCTTIHYLATCHDLDEGWTWTKYTAFSLPSTKNFGRILNGANRVKPFTRQPASRWLQWFFHNSLPLFLALCSLGLYNSHLIYFFTQWTPIDCHNKSCFYSKLAFSGSIKSTVINCDKRMVAKDCIQFYSKTCSNKFNLRRK